MMNMRRLLPVAIFLSGLMMFCAEDQSTQTVDGPVPSFVGSWLGQLPAFPPMIRDSIRITVDIAHEDSSYKLNSYYMTENTTALQHWGTWQATADSIYLTGNQCSAYDTTTKALESRDCGGIIACPIAIENGIWIVSLKDLEGVATALKIDVSSPALQGLLSQIQIGLVKQ